MKDLQKTEDKLEIGNDPMFVINHDLDKYSDMVFESKKYEKAKADLAGVDLNNLEC